MVWQLGLNIYHLSECYLQRFCDQKLVFEFQVIESFARGYYYEWRLLVFHIGSFDDLDLNQSKFF